MARPSEGRTLKGLTLTLEGLHEQQLEVWHSAARFKVCACGRRWGKTTLGVLMALAHALEGGRVWWVAPTYQMAMVGWRMLLDYAVSIPLAEVSRNDFMLSFSRPLRGSVQIRTAQDPQKLRSEGLDFVVMDECALISEDAWYQAIRPALSDRGGGCLFISTPAGRNWFWELWMRAQGGPPSEWAAWRLPTWGNPHIPDTEIAAARRDLPERVFLQEFAAEFLEDTGIVFRGVMSAVGDWEQKQRVDGHTYIMGVDWGKHDDFTVFTIIDANTKEVVFTDRFNQIDYYFQVDRLKALAAKYGVATVVAELNAMGEPLVERLALEGVPVMGFLTTNASKARIIQDLALAIETGELRLANNAELIHELLAYGEKRLPGGLSRYGAPEGAHDDCVMALALAWHGARGDYAGPAIIEL